MLVTSHISHPPKYSLCSELQRSNHFPSRSKQKRTNKQTNKKNQPHLIPSSQMHFYFFILTCLSVTAWTAGHEAHVVCQDQQPPSKRMSWTQPRHHSAVPPQQEVKINFSIQISNVIFITPHINHSQRWQEVRCLWFWGRENTGRF